MGAPLEFKRRVRLPETLGEDERPSRRRSLLAPAGVIGWTLTVALAVAIAEGVIPLERWLPERTRLALAAEPPARSPDRAGSPAPPPFEPAPDEIAASALPAAVTNEPEAEPPPEPPAATPAAAPDPGLAPGADDDDVDPLPEPAAPAEPPQAVEPERAPSEPSEPRERKPEPPPAVASSGKSCEQAAADASYSIEIGKGSGPADLARSAYAAVLDRGSYFEHCGAPESLQIRICAAVQNGAAVGVTVRTTPGMSAVAACIARAVRGLSFPRHPRLDVVTTTFD